jgi:hypothetical protein
MFVLSKVITDYFNLQNIYCMKLKSEHYLLGGLGLFIAYSLLKKERVAGIGGIKIIDGHLTATDKKAIQAILAAGLMEGKVGKSSYFISKNANLYTVKQVIKDRGIMPVPGSQLRWSTYTSTFQIN